MPREEKDRWDKAAILLRPVQALVLAYVGYLLTGSVNSALKRQELDLQAIGGMRETLGVFESEKSTDEQLGAAALTLTVFGERAVQPLVTLLEGASPPKARAAKKALRVLGGTQPTPVCRSLKGSLRRSILHSIFTLNDAVELVGVIRCQEARPEVVALQAAVAGDLEQATKGLSGKVASFPQPTAPAVKDLQDQLAAAIAALDSEGGR